MTTEHPYFSLVLNHVRIDADLPYLVAPDCVLDRPSNEQLVRIQRRLEQLKGVSYDHPRDFFEANSVVEATENGSIRKLVRLPKEEFRYFILKTPFDKGRHSLNLHLAAAISAAPLYLKGLDFWGTEYGGWSLDALAHNLNGGGVAVNITLDDLNDWRDSYSDFMLTAGGYNGVTDFPEIQRAVKMYSDIRKLNMSEFYVLGLFAILEMLITHNPTLEDRGDSITHQIRSKIPLLTHRFVTPFIYTPYFGGCDPKKIWGALYACRSAIAHGGEPNFSNGPLASLKNLQNVKSFMLRFVAALIRHSFKEPQLYRDLRGC